MTTLYNDEFLLKIFEAAQLQQDLRLEARKQSFESVTSMDFERLVESGLKGTPIEVLYQQLEDIDMGRVEDLEREGLRFSRY